MIGWTINVVVICLLLGIAIGIGGFKDMSTRIKDICLYLKYCFLTIVLNKRVVILNQFVFLTNDEYNETKKRIESHGWGDNGITFYTLKDITPDTKYSLVYSHFITQVNDNSELDSQSIFLKKDDSHIMANVKMALFMPFMWNYKSIGKHKGVYCAN